MWQKRRKAENSIVINRKTGQYNKIEKINHIDIVREKITTWMKLWKIEKWIKEKGKVVGKYEE